MDKKPAFSKSTLRGTLLFLLLLIAVFVAPDLWNYLQPPHEFHISYSDPEFQKAVQSIRKNLVRSDEGYEKRSRYFPPPQAFDPNTYALEDWMQLGLSEKQAAVVLKFTRYGIRSNEDLKKIFVISDELYELIKDSTRYPERERTSYRKDFVTEKQEAKPVRKANVNTATEEDLLSVRGIGPFFARQIIRRRDELGGFYEESQLLEVWKMNEENVAQIAPNLIFDGSHLRKLDINRATAGELKAHPYISWNLANSIVKLRSQNGPYKRIEDVRKSVLVTDELYEKLKHYLTVDP